MFVLTGFVSFSAVKSQTTDATRKAADDASATFRTSKKDSIIGWRTGGTFSFAFNESGSNTYYYKVKGGQQTAVGIKAIIDYSFDKHNKNSVWYNNFRGRYGGATSVDANGKNVFLKNDDYLNYTSIIAKPVSKTWSYAGFLSLESQFENSFLTPGYIKFGPAMMYDPNPHFSLILSPVMGNVTTKLANSYRNINIYGVDSGKTAYFGFGAFAQAKANYDLCKGINYKSVATVSNNYLKQPGNLVLDWTNLFTLIVNKYIGATVSLNLRYNDLEINNLQFQQSIGVGFNYKL